MSQFAILIQKANVPNSASNRNTSWQIKMGEQEFADWRGNKETTFAWGLGVSTNNQDEAYVLYKVYF
jgi:hypothetical protein